MASLPLVDINVTELLNLGVIDGSLNLFAMGCRVDMLIVVKIVLLADRAIRVLFIWAGKKLRA